MVDHELLQKFRRPYFRLDLILMRFGLHLFGRMSYKRLIVIAAVRTFLFHPVDIFLGCRQMAEFADRQIIGSIQHLHLPVTPSPGGFALPQLVDKLH